MNTKTEQHQKKDQRQKTQEGQGQKKDGQNPSMLQGNRRHQDHEQEHPETRMTR
jgi:hypothetical protein